MPVFDRVKTGELNRLLIKCHKVAHTLKRNIHVYICNKNYFTVLLITGKLADLLQSMPVHRCLSDILCTSS
jgi:hypothetical protein